MLMSVAFDEQNTYFSEPHAQNEHSSSLSDDDRDALS